MHQNLVMISLATTILFLAVATLATPSPIVESNCGRIPKDYQPPSIATLPDPFQFVNGKRVKSKRDFNCRQKEISSLFQQYELGDKPSDPESVEGSFTNNILTVTVTHRKKTIAFNASISYPKFGKVPYPAIVTLGTSNLPELDGVATIKFNNDQIANQVSPSSSRGVGLFYDLYGKNASAGALAAWAWGLSRIIDALEETHKTNKINHEFVGVTGCSRNGKGAFVAGALDDRVALTIPQESGSGCWRVAEAKQAAGANIQTAPEIIQENVWLSKRFDPWTPKVSSLPIDHHLLAGLVAPRGLFVIDNNIDWLGPTSTGVCMGVGQLIYKALVRYFSYL
jgi:hypothetical protein